jgi:hypothetical protein
VLHHLHELDLVERTGHGRWGPDREALLDRFLAEYPGPGGSEHYCYSLDAPTEVAIRAGQVSAQGRPIVASADVGPDLIVAWRRPSLVILYAKHVMDPSRLGLIDPLADPVQQIWDLQDLGGADRLEVAGRLRQWLLARP